MLEAQHQFIKSFGLVMFLSGLFLIGFATTGKIILGDNTTSDYCKSDISCSNGKVCCEISGMCALSSQCATLQDLFPHSSVESPMRTSSASYFFLGIILIVLAILLFLILRAIENKISHVPVSFPKKTPSKVSKKKTKKSYRR